MKRINRIITNAIAFTVTLGLLSGCSVGATGATNSAVSTASTTATAVTAATTAAVSTADAVSVVFSDSGITASEASGLEIEGTSLSITQSGTYLLSGSCANGSVTVKKGTTGVRLVLNGLDLTADGTAPIVCAKSTAVTIEVAAGTENKLSDTQSNNTETGSADGENAVIKCKDGSNVVLCGTGTLTISAQGKNGIKSGASTETEGTASLTIRELTLNIDAPVNDAVNAEALLNVESGTLNISAGDDALHCDGTLNIGAEDTQGPAITITTCYEGLEGATVNVFSGDISIVASDDCINAANPDLTNYNYSMNISGGTITAYTSSGDGFDSNGDMTISGGTVIVWSANTADNQPLDADGTITISGGTVLAAGGSSGMGMNLSAQQACLTFSGTGGFGGGQPSQGGMGGSLLSENSSFSILDSQGAALYSGTARCNTAFLLFSAPELTDGDSCTLSSGSSQTEAQAQTGTVSTGRGGMGGMGGPGGDRQNGGQKPDGKGFDPSQNNNRGDQPTGEPPQGGPQGSGL